MEDCVFCKIVKGDIPSEKIYEDDDVFAFLDRHPFGKGHTLVVSKQHFANIFEIPEDLLCKVNSVVKRLAENIKDKLQPEGIIILQNNGEKAGQSVFHYHVHIKPVYKESTVLSDSPHRTYLDDAEMKDICQKLKTN